MTSLGSALQYSSDRVTCKVHGTTRRLEPLPLHPFHHGSDPYMLLVKPQTLTLHTLLLNAHVEDSYVAQEGSGLRKAQLVLQNSGHILCDYAENISQTFNLEPLTSNPQHGKLHRDPQIPSPRPCTILSPKPPNPNPIPSSLNLKPQALNPEP